MRYRIRRLSFVLLIPLLQHNIFSVQLIFTDTRNNENQKQIKYHDTVDITDDSISIIRIKGNQKVIIKGNNWDHLSVTYLSDTKVVFQGNYSGKKLTVTFPKNEIYTSDKEIINNIVVQYRKDIFIKARKQEQKIAIHIPEQEKIFNMYIAYDGMINKSNLSFSRYKMAPDLLVRFFGQSWQSIFLFDENYYLDTYEYDAEKLITSRIRK